MHHGPTGTRSPSRCSLALAGTGPPAAPGSSTRHPSSPLAAIGPLAARAAGRPPKLAKGSPAPRPGGNPFPAAPPSPHSRGNLLPAAVPSMDRGNPLPAPRPPRVSAAAARRTCQGRAETRHLSRLVPAVHPSRPGGARSRGAGGPQTRIRRLCGGRSPRAPRSGLRGWSPATCEPAPPIRLGRPRSWTTNSGSGRRASRSTTCEPGNPRGRACAVPGPRASEGTCAGPRGQARPLGGLPRARSLLVGLHLRGLPGLARPFPPRSRRPAAQGAR